MTITMSIASLTSGYFAMAKQGDGASLIRFTKAEFHF